MAEGIGSATLYRIDFMRNLNLVVKIVGEGNSEVVINLTDGEKEYYLREDDKNVIYNKMSSYQRAKIESFFGKMNAYYTQIEIL